MKIYKQLSDVGAGDISLPAGDAKAPSVGDVVRPRYRGDERFAFLVENIDHDKTGEKATYSGRGLLALLDQAVVWEVNPGDKSRNWSGATYAEILIDLIDEAQVRGCFPALTYDFTDTEDSEAQSWTESVDITLKVGTSLLQVARDFAQVGIDLVITSSYVLQAYVSAGNDNTDDVVFRVGQNCKVAKNATNTSALRNVLVTDYQGGRLTVSDATSISAYGRRESLYSISQASDATTAQAFADNELAARKDPRESVTIEVVDADGVLPRVFVDYDIGDLVSVDFGDGVLHDYRVRGLQVSAPQGTNGADVTVELNTIALETELRNAIALQRNFPGLTESVTNTTQTADAGVELEAHNSDPNAHPNLTHDATKIQGEDVDATTPTDKDALIYNDGNSQWEPTPIDEDVISLSDTTTGNATTGRHGFLPKLDNSGTKYLRDDGTWQTVSGTSLTVKEEDGTPSVSGVTEIKVTNGTLTDNGSGSVSISTGGGGGGGAPTTAEYITTAADGTLSGEVVIPGLAGAADKSGILQPGESAAATSYEFDSGASPLTWTSAPTSESVDTSVKSHLYITDATGSAIDGTFALAPAGAFEIIAKINGARSNNSYDGVIALIVMDSGGTNGAFLQQYISGTNISIRAFTLASGTATQRGSTIIYGGTSVYFKIIRDGSNNFSFEYSSDGIAWTRITTQSHTVTLAKAGLRLNSINAANTLRVAVDFFRSNV